MTAYRETKARYGEAALDFVRLEIFAVFKDRVDDVALNTTNAIGEDALADAHLGSGKACAFHVLHGFHHVCDQLGELRTEFSDGIGYGAQHRIPNDSDTQNCHLLSVLTIVTLWSGCCGA